MFVALGSWLRSWFALLVVLVAFVWSGLAILSHRAEESPPGVTVTLRLAHWQLETGVRDAFEEMAAQYANLHPNVRIRQEAIPEGTYGQWITTQLMGGTAPDMFEIGMVPYHVQLGYYNRYLVPLTLFTAQPNSYNEGTEHHGVPWRKTYKDAMRGGYVEEVQEYMSVPLSQFGIRIFYNRDLFTRLTGLESPPREFRAFLEACQKIRSQRDAQGRHYTAITGSKYHVGMWDGYMAEVLSFGAVRQADYNRDGNVGADEAFVAFKTGQLDLGFPSYAARFAMLRLLCDQFQVGFTGLGRDEAVFLFAQQKAVFISTGTWDAFSLMEQAKGSFEVGVMNFPMPAADDVEFGSVMEGPRYERPEAAFKFGITRTSEHPEVALDFLRFMGSQRGNERMNQIIGWIPAITQTQLHPMLEAFEPNLVGVYGAMPLGGLGGETYIQWAQLLALFHVNQIDFANFRLRFEPFYLERGVREFEEMQRNRRRGVFRDDQFLAGFRARAMQAQSEEAHTLWVKYRQLTGERLVRRELANSRLLWNYTQGPVPGATAPYELSPQVMQRVRARLEAPAHPDAPAAHKAVTR